MTKPPLVGPLEQGGVCFGVLPAGMVGKNSHSSRPRLPGRHSFWECCGDERSRMVFLQERRGGKGKSLFLKDKNQVKCGILAGN